MAEAAETGADGPARPLFNQVLSFGAVGLVGFVANAGLVALLSGAIGPERAQLLAFPVAVTTTWSLNRRYTFRARGGGLLREWLRYILANALGWAANNGLFFVLIMSMPFVHRQPVLAVAAGSVAGMVFNFTTSKRFVFR